MDAALAEEQNTAQTDAVQSVFLAVLNAPELDIRDKKAAIIDFIAAGIQTVSKSVILWKIMDIIIYLKKICLFSHNFLYVFSLETLWCSYFT